MITYFTNYEHKEKNEKIKAVMWDGDYSLYRNLIKFETNFIGVLDDKGQKGKDFLKLWDEESNTWVDCEKGSYIVKKVNNTFKVSDKQKLFENYKRVEYARNY